MLTSTGGTMKRKRTREEDKYLHCNELTDYKSETRKMNSRASGKLITRLL